MVRDFEPSRHPASHIPAFRVAARNADPRLNVFGNGECIENPLRIRGNTVLQVDRPSRQFRSFVNTPFVLCTWTKAYDSANFAWAFHTDAGDATGPPIDKARFSL